MIVHNRKHLSPFLKTWKSATNVVNALHEKGFSLDKIELVSKNVQKEAPEVTTPYTHETTSTSLVEGAAKWGGVGAGLGVIGSILTPFPGVGLGMIIMGGMTGAIVGGMAGVEHALEDDSIDLPTLQEYQQILNNDEKIVVILGTHEEVMQAEKIINDLPHSHSHIHAVHGHLFHEHPANQSKN